MSDLIERLREHGWSGCDEAADELERLRDELATFKAEDDRNQARLERSS